MTYNQALQAIGTDDAQKLHRESTQLLKNTSR